MPFPILYLTGQFSTNHAFMLAAEFQGVENRGKRMFASSNTALVSPEAGLNLGGTGHNLSGPCSVVPEPNRNSMDLAAGARWSSAAADASTPWRRSPYRSRAGRRRCTRQTHPPVPKGYSAWSLSFLP